MKQRSDEAVRALDESRADHEEAVRAPDESRADHGAETEPGQSRGGAKLLRDGRGCGARGTVGGRQSRGSAKTCRTEPAPGGRCMVSGNASRAFRHEMLQPGPDGTARYWRPSTA